MNILATLAFLAAALAAAAACQAGDLQAKSTLNLRVVVPAIVSLKVIESTPDTAVVEILCTMKNFRLHFEISDPAVVAVDVEGLDFPVRVLPGGTHVLMPVRGANDRFSRKSLSYRVHLAAGTTPGPRRSPIALSVAGI